MTESISWKYAFKVWYRDFLVWTRYWWTSLFGALGEPVLYFVGFGYGLGALIKEVEGVPYLEFLAPALICSAIMHSASFETTYSSYTRMEIQKTFHSIAMTPVSVREVVVGEILWGATKSLLSGGVMFAAIAIMGLVHSPMALFAIPVLIITALLFSSLGMLMTSFARDYDFFTYYITLGLEPMFIFSGTFFPTHSLPPLVQRLTWLLPLSHPISITRGLFSGKIVEGFWISLLWISVLTIAIFRWSIRRMENRLVV
ncbi:MAG: ABC transporter permease [Deltaproteobacteria bacterium]|nr:MAG: ABC transporter permease [Deltaproteobacteria bacterium]